MPPTEAQDKGHIAHALELAARAYGRTSPNPLVGAVIVKDGRVVGEGYHHRAGEKHAEILALEEAGEAARGATLYCNLEPCCTIGRTGACTEAIIPAGISRVVVSMRDPNPENSQGLKRLEQAGIEVTLGVGAVDAARLNAPFIKRVTLGLPYTIVKMAMSLDGKIATNTGDSMYITGEESRHKVHQLRNEADAVMVGIGTVLADNPQLNVRIDIADLRHPQKIIVDSKARVPSRCRTITKDPRTIVAVAAKASPTRLQALREVGASVEIIEGSPVRVDVRELMKRLSELGIVNLLIEGGGGLAASLFEAGLVDEVVTFVAPIIVGGTAAPGPVGGQGIKSLTDAHLLSEVTWEQIGSDMMIRGRVVNGEQSPTNVTISE